MDVKDVAGKALEENEEDITGNQRKGHPCYKVAENSAEMCSMAGWKELVSNDLGYQAEEIPKQIVDDVDWFLHTTYSKT